MSHLALLNSQNNDGAQKLIFVFRLYAKNKKSKMTSIINPNFSSVTNDLMHLSNAVKCNFSKNVHAFIKAGNKYAIELPATNEIINVICTGKGLNAADMKIHSHFINGEKNPDEEQYTFSYKYDSFGAIHFASFKYLQECNLYISVDDMF
jgi:hypothetical protein